MNGPDNAAIAELLIRAAVDATGNLHRALRRASRAAHLWPVEAAALVAEGRSLKELPSIGPHLARLVGKWIEQPPPLDDPVPPIRRNFLTLAQARAILARHPDWAARYKGDLQMHSQWSDGNSTIAALAEEAIARGYSYIAITDHSKGLKIAGGINEADLARQGEEIRQSNATFGNKFRVLRSVELNLNPRGEGDMEADSLARLDLVVGSFHSKLREKEDQTERYLAALRNPAVHILGHPVGRIYNHRAGLAADWPRVFALAVKLDKALEIDSYPDRQDLSVELLLIAKAEGARIAIDTDAHSPAQLAFVELGLAAALLAGIPPERIVNFMPLAELLRWAAAR